MSLLSRHERRVLFKTVKFSTKAILVILSTFIAIVIYLIYGIYNLFKWIYNINFYKKHGFTYLELYKKINHMSGRQFEIFMFELFKANKIPCKLTSATCDGGKDLICKIDNQTTYVELKRWNDNWKVDRPTIQKLIGACVGDNITNAIFCTTGQYTNEAIEYASKVPYLTLWNMEDVINLCKQVEDKIPYILAKCEVANGEDIYNRLKLFNGNLEKCNNNLDHKIRKLDFQNKYY